MRTTIVAVALLATGCAGLQFGGADRQRETAESVRESVKGTTPAYAKYDPEGQKLWKLTRAFYEQREFLPAWIEGTSPRPQMKALMRALSAAEHEGLDPELYTVSMLEKKHSEATRGFLTDKGFDPAEAGTLDVWLTYLYLRYASDLADGLSNLVHADKAWQIAPEKFDARAHLEAALDANRVEESLAELTPRNGEYGRLRELLARYREQKARGGWPLMPNVRLKPGQKSAHVATLARRLAASGDYTGPIPQAGIASPYSPALQAAVKVFQRRHGLADDGIVGPAAIAALNVPIDQRIEQVAMNMERWRWLPRDLGERYILVNIPEMRLDVYESGTIPLSMRVVVGKSETPTPIFNDRMTYLVFSPYWNVPPGIAEGETLPALLNDPDFLARNNMEVLDASGNIVDPETMDLTDPTAYRFRQKPGTHNSLGLVKFMFPNQFNVYLHDTPSGSLFERATRSFSHGCVRVEDPVALARYLLRDQPAWTADRIREAMHAGQETSVKLKTPIPVYLGYWTARVRPDNTVQFRPDVYRVDRRLSARLDDRLERLRKTAAAAAKATTVEK
ncbi:MAG TPA: L,D-transpeptidase family protein [Vicinamibacterales bacterium]